MKDHDLYTEKELLFLILKELKTMAVDVSKLTASVAQLSIDVDALVAAHVDPSVQTAIDNATATVNALSVKVEAALVPPPAPAA